MKNSINLSNSVLFQYVMSMPEDDPRKMEDIRKFSAIYGRFDCKRKPEKPLTLHEVRRVGTRGTVQEWQLQLKTKN